MEQNTLALFLALGATLAFATSSLAFAESSRSVSVLWMNCFKAAVAFIALLITVPIFSGWHSASILSISGLLMSGLLALNIGDLFLLNAFTKLGVGRTLILFGFQPLFIGLSAFFLFGQPFESTKLLAILFLIGCLVTFSIESYKTEKKWELAGLLYALIGVVLDTCGVLITRASFAESPLLTPMEGHFYRCLGALIGFAAMSLLKPIRLKEGFMRKTVGQRTKITAACITGTFLSLLLYLSALKIGHLASIAAIAITGPIFATFLECFLHRKPPSRYLFTALGFFCVGFYILLATS